MSRSVLFLVILLCVLLLSNQSTRRIYRSNYIQVNNVKLSRYPFLHDWPFFKVLFVISCIDIVFKYYQTDLRKSLDLQQYNFFPNLNLLRSIFSATNCILILTTVHLKIYETTCKVCSIFVYKVGVK